MSLFLNGEREEMTVWEIILIGAALAMDAVAVGMTDGMTEPRMPFSKVVAIAGAFALFQFLMPVLGYCFGSVFASVVRKIAPWLSFAILLFLGGKMILDCAKELTERKKFALRGRVKELTAAGLFAQAVATSIDALAVGVTLLAAETTRGLPFSADLCALVIGGVTFALSFAAVLLGRRAGNFFAEKAEILGGAILVLIGVKILLEGLC
ncbi:MAG: manganese efflux pump MntP family protein [Candidatus Gallimonas sp.]